MENLIAVLFPMYKEFWLYIIFVIAQNFVVSETILKWPNMYKIHFHKFIFYNVFDCEDIFSYTEVVV